MDREVRMQGRRHSLLALLAAGAALASLRPRRALAHGGAHAEPLLKHLQVLRPKVEPLPAIKLTTMQGAARTLDRELANTNPLVLNFVFTTCSTSCSLITAVLAQVQQALTAKGRKLQLASITIDPANDTPEQLRGYARKFGAGADWQFYTGQFDDLVAVQRIFDVYRGSKVSHPPVLMLRRDQSAPWVRIEGFPTPQDVLALIETLPKAA